MEHQPSVVDIYDDINDGGDVRDLLPAPKELPQMDRNVASRWVEIERRFHNADPEDMENFWCCRFTFRPQMSRENPFFEFDFRRLSLLLQIGLGDQTAFRNLMNKNLHSVLRYLSWELRDTIPGRREEVCHSAMWIVEQLLR